MGQNLSNVVKTDVSQEGGPATDVAREQLELLMKLAEARLDSYQHKLESQFIDKESMFKFKTRMLDLNEC
jgi:hypothetical protein